MILNNQNFIFALTIYFALAGIAAQARADKTTPPDSAPGSAARFPQDPLQPIAEAVEGVRGVTESHHITFNLGYTLIWQFTSRSNVIEPAHSLVSGSYDLDGFWNVIPHHNGFGDGGVGWLIEGGHNLSHNQFEDLSGNIGSGLGLNDDQDATTDIALTELWWQHNLGPVTAGPNNMPFQEFDPIDVAAQVEGVTHLVSITAGKIDQTAFFDANRVANDQTMQFLSTPLVNSVAIAFPDNGLGINAWVQPNHWIYVTLGLGDANAVGTRGPSTFRGSELFYAAEVGFMPVIPGFGQGNYRFTAWTTRFDNGAGGTESGSGFSLSFDQEVATGVIPFFRFSQGNHDVLDFDRMIEGGVGFESPFGRADDMIGIGYVNARPSDKTLDDESLIEAFYRVKVTNTIEVSPVVQIVFDPIDNPNKDTIIVGAIRTQFSF